MLSTLACCVACSEEKMEVAPKSDETFSPLFGFTISEGKAGETRLFYLPESDGYLYLLPNEEGGMSCGFVSTTRSISSEAIFKSDADISTACVWENGRDRAYVLTDQELFTLLLSESGAHKTALPEGFVLSNPMNLQGITFVNESEGLLLVHPVDFSATYVLAQTEPLSGYSELLLTTDEGKKIWYARGGENGYTGLGYFEYGSNEPLGTEDFTFDAFTPVSENAILFTRKTENGALYLYRNFKTGEMRSMVSSTVFEGVTCDPAGRILCGSISSDNGAKVHVMDIASGTKKGEHPLEYGTLSPSLAMSKDASTLLIAIGTGNRAIIGSIDLTKF